MGNTTTLVTGGCKSGKSSHALLLAESIIEKKNKKGKKIFLATSVPKDKEMEERVAAHRKERGRTWLTVEEPVFLSDVIKENSTEASLILIDCLTLWISNMLYKEFEKEDIAAHVKKLAQSVKESNCPVIIVSNEVGSGIVPENELSRTFRDIAGVANQEIARAVTHVVWTVAGIPVNIK